MSEEIPIIYIGKKPIGNYLYALRKVAEKSKIIKISARGVLISKAVAVAQIFAHKGVEEKVLSIDVEIGSIEATNKLGKNIFVSTMTITIKVI